jgi:hypothetical protein
MAQATSISLSKLTSSVQAAVKAAAAKHPKFKVETPQGVTISYMIRGYPLPEVVAASVTLSEVQAYADTVVEHIGESQPAIRDFVSPSSKGKGAVLCVGGHIICGYPPVTEPIIVEA